MKYALIKVSSSNVKCFGNRDLKTADPVVRAYLFLHMGEALGLFHNKNISASKFLTISSNEKLSLVINYFIDLYCYSSTMLTIKSSHFSSEEIEVQNLIIF